MSRLLFLLVAMSLLGCGGPRTAAPSTGPTCATVADHLVGLAERDNGATASPTLAANLRQELERGCRDDAWTPARRDCLAAAADQDATLACPTE